MEKINTAVLDKLDDNFQQLLKDAPDLRADLHRRVGAAIKQHLDSAITVSVNDENEHIRHWQVVKIGTHGGYAAIRPVDSGDGEPTGANSPGAITNYLTSGHAVRKPGGNAKHYRPRSKMLLVKGKNFYQSTETQAERIAHSETQKWATELANKIAKGL